VGEGVARQLAGRGDQLGLVDDAESLFLRQFSYRLPGARRLADEFDIDSAPGQGCRVTITKWKAF
jgi:anti-sigma regulatory factor (Ser/Thr protein kinase)